MASASAAAAASGRRDWRQYEEYDPEVVVLPTLKAPTGSDCSLLQCEQDPRELAKLKRVDTDAEVTLDMFENSAGHPCARTRNVIVVVSDDIPGFHVFSVEHQHVELARLVYFFEQLSESTAAMCRKIQALLADRQEPRTTIGDIYNAAADAHQNMIIDRVRSMSKHMSMDLDTLTDADYVYLAALHLYYTFSGGKNALMPHKTLVVPLSIALFGQELWWVMHLVCPKLDAKYRSVMASRIRPDRRDASAFLFDCGESFATDFWMTWVQSMATLRTSASRLGGPRDTLHFAESVRKLLGLSPSEVITSSHEDKFIAKSVIFFMSKFGPKKTTDRSVCRDGSGE